MLKNIKLKDLGDILDEGQSISSNTRLREEIINKIKNIDSRNNFPSVNLDMYYCDGNEKDFNVGSKDRLIVFINAEKVGDKTGSNVEDTEEYGKLLRHTNSDNCIEIDGKVVAEYSNRDCNMLFILFDMIKHDKELKTFEKIMNEMFKIDQKKLSYKIEENREGLIKSIQDKLVLDNVRKRDSARRNIEDLEFSIRDNINRIIQCNKDIEHNKILLHGNDLNATKIKDKIIKDLDIIFNYKKVDDVLIDEDTIIVKTKVLNFFDEKGTEYIGSNYSININTSRNEIRIFGNNTKKGGWSDTDSHPHINGTNGQACFGNLNTTLADLFSQKEYYAMTLMLINFLESVDIKDSVGKFAYKWDRIVNGEIIPASDAKVVECYHCGRHITEDEDVTRAYLTIETDEDGNEYVDDAVDICEDCRCNNFYYHDELDEYIRDEY